MPQSSVWTTHQYASANPYEFVDIIQSAGRPPAPQQVFGTLLEPEHYQTPVSCVVMAHGSMGWRGHHHEYMVRLLEHGIAVFRVHSFDARNVRSVVEDQMSVTMAMMLADCFGALRLLRGFSEINADSIGIAGWSLGGGVALYAALEQLAAPLAADNARFAAHLALYPAAHIRPADNRWSAAPVLVYTGECDDYTPAHYIQGLAPLMRAGGAQVDVQVLPDAHHSFDSPDPLAWLPKARRLGTRSYDLAADGRMSLHGAGGAVHAANTRDDRARMFAATDNVGAHTGVNWAARRRSLAGGVAFLARELGDDA